MTLRKADIVQGAQVSVGLAKLLLTQLELPYVTLHEYLHLKDSEPDGACSQPSVAGNSNQS